MPQTAVGDKAGGDAAVRALRIIAIATWLPSLALSISHGVLSRQVYPSTGIIPHTLSAILSICVLRMSRETESEPEAESDAESATVESHQPNPLSRILHPFFVFLMDVAITAGFIWVLVNTWIQGGRSNGLSMLAAYTTVPLMANLAINASCGLFSLYKGLAIDNIIQWVAWRAVPADCPNCHHNLRPASLPEIPWLKRSKRRDNIAPVLVDQQRYRDESDVEEEYTDEGPRQQMGGAVQSKRVLKGKSAPFPSNPDLPWNSSNRDY